jgi:hypothetical protein
MVTGTVWSVCKRCSCKNGLLKCHVFQQLPADLSPRMLRLQLVFGLLYMIQKRFGLAVVVFFDVIEFGSKLFIV